MKHLSIANTWVNALLTEFDHYGLNVSYITRDLPGFENGKLLENSRLDLLSARLLWHRAQKLSDDPLLGARIGMTVNQRSIGVLGPILWHSDSIELVLRNVQKFQTLISENGTFQHSYNRDSDEVTFRYQESPAVFKSPTQQILSVTVGTINMIDTLSQGRSKAKALFVPDTLPNEALKRLLTIENVNTADSFSFVIDRSALSIQIQGCDLELYKRCLDYANAMLSEKQLGFDFIQNVRRYVANNGLVAADINRLAEQLNSSPRYVQRQLASYGTSFTKLKDEILKERVIAEFHKTQDIQSIALAIGYTELSGFYKAFKKWFGMTPKKALREGFEDTQP